MRGAKIRPSLPPSLSLTHPFANAAALAAECNGGSAQQKSNLAKCPFWHRSRQPERGRAGEIDWRGRATSYSGRTGSKADDGRLCSLYCSAAGKRDSFSKAVQSATLILLRRSQDLFEQESGDKSRLNYYHSNHSHPHSLSVAVAVIRRCTSPWNLLCTLRCGRVKPKAFPSLLHTRPVPWLRSLPVSLFW